MSSLIVASRTAALAKQTNELGTSRSSAGIAWTVRSPTWADHPGIAEAPADGVLAETITVVGIRKHAGGKATQVRRGFRAYRDRIVIVEFARPVTKASDGRYRPSGSWNHTATTHKSDSPTRTRGSVPTGRLTNPTVEAAASQSTNSSAESRAAAEAESFLPAPVRASLREVPVTGAHIGTFLLIGEGASAEQQVTVLRLGGAAAVAVRAVRADGADAPWDVTQWVYRFPQNHRLVGSTAAPISTEGN